MANLGVFGVEDNDPDNLGEITKFDKFLQVKQEGPKVQGRRENEDVEGRLFRTKQPMPEDERALLFEKQNGKKV